MKTLKILFLYFFIGVIMMQLVAATCATYINTVTMEEGDVDYEGNLRIELLNTYPGAATININDFYGKSGVDRSLTTGFNRAGDGINITLHEVNPEEGEIRFTLVQHICGIEKIKDSVDLPISDGLGTKNIEYDGVPFTLTVDQKDNLVNGNVLGPIRVRIQDFKGNQIRADLELEDFMDYGLTLTFDSVNVNGDIVFKVEDCVLCFEYTDTSSCQYLEFEGIFPRQSGYRLFPSNDPYNTQLLEVLYFEFEDENTNWLEVQIDGRDMIIAEGTSSQSENWWSGLNELTDEGIDMKVVYALNCVDPYQDSSYIFCDPRSEKLEVDENKFISAQSTNFGILEFQLIPTDGFADIIFTVDDALIFNKGYSDIFDGSSRMYLYSNFMYNIYGAVENLVLDDYEAYFEVEVYECSADFGIPSDGDSDPSNEVPEFSTIAIVGVVSILGLFLYRKRRI